MTYIASAHIRPTLRPIDRTSPAFKAEPLKLKLARLKQEQSNADWDGDECRIVALDYEIRMVEFKLSIGETHDHVF